MSLTFDTTFKIIARIRRQHPNRNILIRLHTLEPSITNNDTSFSDHPAAHFLNGYGRPYYYASTLELKLSPRHSFLRPTTSPVQTARRGETTLRSLSPQRGYSHISFRLASLVLLQQPSVLGLGSSRAVFN